MNHFFIFLLYYLFYVIVFKLSGRILQIRYIPLRTCFFVFVVPTLMIATLIIVINKYFQEYEYNIHFNFFIYLFFEALTIFLFLTGISFLRSLALVIVYRIVSFVIIIAILIPVAHFTDFTSLESIDKSIKNFDIEQKYNINDLEKYLPSLPVQPFQNSPGK